MGHFIGDEYTTAGQVSSRLIAVSLSLWDGPVDRTVTRSVEFFTS